MIELITVFTVITLIILGWIALCIEAQGVKEGFKMAIAIPLAFTVMISAIVWILYSFAEVLRG